MRREPTPSMNALICRVRDWECPGATVDGAPPYITLSVTDYKAFEILFEKFGPRRIYGGVNIYVSRFLATGLFWTNIAQLLPDPLAHELTRYHQGKEKEK